MSGTPARWNGCRTDNYATRSIPSVVSREPLWDQPNLSKDVEEGRYYLPGTATGGREALVTSPFDARPQYILQIPGPGWQPLLAAVFTAAFFLLLTVKLVLPSRRLRRAGHRLRDLVAVGNRSRSDPSARRYRRRHRAAGLCRPDR